jgi:hypothetical protein
MSLPSTNVRETSPTHRAAPYGLPAPVVRLLARFHIDFPTDPRRTAPVSWVVATLLAIFASLGADALLVDIAGVLFPSTKGYVHFRFSDYGKLTVLGVIVACVAWPVVVRISSRPTWVFVRMAVLVSVVLLLPDVWILVQGQPAEAVATLMVMHLAIAVVTFEALVRLARPR